MEKFIEKKLEPIKIKKLLTGLFDADKGRFKHVNSVAIFSCQNPTKAIIQNKPFLQLLKSFNKDLSDWNLHSMQLARKLLKRYRFRVVDGLYGGHEKSFIVFNMTRKEVENFNKKFYQESYMFLNLVDDINPKIGSGLSFGIDANNNIVRKIVRNGKNNEASKKVAFIETWSRSDELDKEGSNVHNPYTLMETSFGISIDFSKINSMNHFSMEDKNMYQTRVSKDFGFTALYTKYGQNINDYDGSSLNLKLKNNKIDDNQSISSLKENSSKYFSDSDFEDIYNRSLDNHKSPEFYLNNKSELLNTLKQFVFRNSVFEKLDSNIKSAISACIQLVAKSRYI